MMKGLITMDENVSNFASASGEISASSGSRVETSGTMYPQQQSFASSNQAQAPKKKRSLPGNPDPDAEVIALSPKTLLATNRFICEICNKGFQRDQNLQLHRRGHNLPWKLKQRTNKEVIRKKVYVCPETTCVHHDPSRALGDLTGIKKHFCRKHGEKKWKCEKCSKRYAVQSDWKAHSKICGTREYRCDCGTLFSRRDSFITHRAFCDALAEENARSMTVHPILSSHHHQQMPPHAAAAGSAASHHMLIDLQPSSLSVKREQESHHLFNSRPDHNVMPPWLACSPVGEAGPAAGPPQINLSSSSQLFSTSGTLDQSLLQNDQNPSSNPNPPPPLIPSPFQSSSSAAAAASPHMSATALLQKAAQMGVTMSKSKSKPSPPSPAAAPAMLMMRPHQAHMSENVGFSTSTSSSSGMVLSSREDMGSGFGYALASFGNKAAAAAAVTTGIMEQIAAAGGGGGGGGPTSLVPDMMASTVGFIDGSSFDDQDFSGILLNPKRATNFQEVVSKSTEQSSQLISSRSIDYHPHEAAGRVHLITTSTAVATGGNDGLTRDFLGLKGFPHKDFLNIAAGLDHHLSPSTYRQRINQNQPHWQG